jgi:hypothetical protein
MVTCSCCSGDVVRHCAEDAGVDMKYSLVDEAEGAEIGFFNVLPDQQRVWYQVSPHNLFSQLFLSDCASPASCIVLAAQILFVCFGKRSRVLPVEGRVCGTEPETRLPAAVVVSLHGHHAVGV